MAQPAREFFERADRAVSDEVSDLKRLAEDILERCRGEGPANCVARCPLHVDARSYVQLTHEGKFREALQKVRERLPFPGVLGYVCAHPCELHCKRIDDDSAIRIRDIKRFLAEWEPGEPQHILECEPDRGKEVAVVGAGPGGLLAAHDLRRQGYAVTVFEKEDRIGGCLVHKIPSWRLPREIVERDLSIIDALGIEVRTGVAVGEDTSLSELIEGYDAVVLTVGFAGNNEVFSDEPRLRRTVRDTLWADPVTCETGIDGVFAGGDSVSGPATVVTSMAMGRRAAESADRHLRGEPLREDREGPMPPRLLWTLEIEEAERKARERTPVMLTPPAEALSEEEAIEEAGRCLDCECGLCVEDCEFLDKYCDSPKELARQVLADELSDDVLKMVYSCNICSLCAEVCPEDLDTGEMLIEARREAVRRGVGPLPGHKGIVSYFNAGVSKTFSLLRSEPGRQKSKRLFFTGCALPATAPKYTRRVYEELRRGYPGMGIMMYCCGAPVELLGMEEEFLEAKGGILRQVEEVGAEELVVACPDCAHTLHSRVPEVPVRTVWELLAETWDPPKLRDGEVVTVHDSCKARHMPETHDAVRRLVEAGGAEVRDIEYRGELARCCGFGGMIAPVDQELVQTISRRRGGESECPMVTYCSGCRIALRSSGKESVHILDLLLDEKGLSDLAGAKPKTGLIQYVNRLRTKWAFKRLRPITRE